MAKSLPFKYLEREVVERMARPTHTREKFLELSCVFARRTVRDKVTGVVDTCAICHEEMEVQEIDDSVSADGAMLVSNQLAADHSVLVEECDHYFHRECLLENTKFSSKCPSCRNPWFDSAEERKDNLELKDIIAFTRSGDFDDYERDSSINTTVHPPLLAYDIRTAAYCIMTDWRSRVHKDEAHYFPRGVGASHEAHIAIAALFEAIAMNDETKRREALVVSLEALHHAGSVIGPNTSRLEVVRMFVIKAMFLGMSIYINKEALGRRSAAS